MTPATVRVALAQTSWAGTTEATLDRLEATVLTAARRGAHLVAFPELCTTPYFCDRRDPAWRNVAEPIPDGPTLQRLARVAADTALVLVVTLPERDPSGRHYNSAAVIDADGRLAGCYRKQHLPHEQGAWERFYFEPGDNGWPVFSTAAGRLGVLICWDRYFPDGWRALSLAGAQIIVNPVASTIPRTDRLATLIQPAEALANQVFVITVNRAGHDEPGGAVYSGGSFAVGPDGAMLGRRASGRPQLAVRDLELSRLDTVRSHTPHLAAQTPPSPRPSPTPRAQ
jgi:beta-ureidopropionase